LDTGTLIAPPLTVTVVDEIAVGAVTAAKRPEFAADSMPDLTVWHELSGASGVAAHVAA
jgi:hypothetical protein